MFFTDLSIDLTGSLSEKIEFLKSSICSLLYFSVDRIVSAIVETAWIGNLPIAASADSITVSAPWKIAVAISMQAKQNGSKGRLVIITQGADPVVCVNNGQVMEFPAERLPADKIVDTNGAGDAFVGGARGLKAAPRTSSRGEYG